MTVPSFLQNKTYSTNVPSATHALTMSSPIRYRGGTTSPSSLVMTLSYDGVSGDQCNSITDSDGNTWLKGTSANNGVSINGEMWYAYNIKGGTTPTITANMASSVNMTMVCVELDQVRPVSPIDQALSRIDTTLSTARTSAATNTTKRTGMLEIVVGGIAWSHVTLTCSNGGSGFSGTLVSIKDGSTGIGAGMVRRTADLANLTGANTIGRFTMSASTNSPCAVMSLSFQRDGIVTSTSEDGWINDFEGTATVGNLDTSGTLFKSSTSAPFGATGGSEYDQCYFFFPDFSANILSGCTIDSTLTFNYSSQGGFDDGTGYMNAYLYAYKAGELGSTLDTADEFPGGGVDYSLGVDPITPGIRSVTIDKSTSYNTSGVTAMRMSMEGDTGGGFSGTYAQINFYEGNATAYLQLGLQYPSEAPSGGQPPFPHWMFRKKKWKLFPWRIDEF